MTRHLTTFIRSISFALIVIGLGAVAQAETFAYVVNRGRQDVSVVDLSTNTVTASIPVPTPFNIVVSPDGSHVYVASLQTVFAVLRPFLVSIDTATNSVVANIQLNGNQVQVGQGMAFSPDSTKLYATDPGPSGGAVDVIDTATNTITAVIPMPDVNIRSLLISPDGSRIYVASRFIGDVYVADTATNTVIATIPEVPGPLTGTSAMAISPDGSRLYTSDGGFTGFMSIIDTATNSRITTFPTLGSLFTMTITPDGTKIYATEQPDSGPYVLIDTTTLTTSILGDGFRAWWQAAITPDGAFAYITDQLGDTLEQFDTTTNVEVASIQLPMHPIHSAGGASGIAIGTIPPAIPFAAFNVAKLQLNKQGFSESGSFTLGAPAHAAAASAGIDPVTQRVTLTIGNYTLIIPPGSFRKDGPNLHWKFEGTVDGVKLNAGINQQGKSTTQFDYSIEAKGPDLTGQPQPIRAGFRIGLNVGTALIP